MRGRFWILIQIAAVALFAGASLMAALEVPHGGMPDEDGHANYVKSIATGQGLPIAESVTGVVTEEIDDGSRIAYASAQAHHPPVYHALVAVFYRMFRYNETALFLSGRLLSALFGLISLLLLRSAIISVLPEGQDVAAAALVVIAASPTFSFIMGSMNNEGLAALVVVLAIWLAAPVLSTGRMSTARAALLGMSIGLALVVKLTAVVAAMPVILAFVAFMTHSTPPRTQTYAVVRRMVVAAAAVGILAAPWYARNLIVLGTPTFNCNVRPAFWSLSGPLVFPEVSSLLLLSVLEELVTGLWSLNWLLRDWPPLLATYASLSRTIGLSATSVLVEAAQLALLVFGSVGAWRIVKSRRTETGASVTGEALLAAVPLAVFAMLVIGLVRQTLFVDAQVARWAARYSPVALPALAMLIGMSWRQIAPHRLRKPLLIIMLISAIALQFTATMRFMTFYS